MKITVEFDSLDELDAFCNWRAERKAAGKTPLEGSGLDHKTMRILMSEGFAFVEDAQAKGDHELLRMSNFGRSTLAALRAWKKPPPTA